MAHSLALDRLAAWMSTATPSLGAPVSASQFTSGEGNPTFLLALSDGTRAVLRKRPPGTTSRALHRVDREYYILRALAGRGGVPVPRPFALCLDDRVVGTHFFLMQFLDGKPVFASRTLAEVADAGERWGYYRSAVRALAALQAVPWRELDLPESIASKVGGFYERQLAMWEVLAREQAGGLPHRFGDMVAWIRGHLPADETCVVQGDFTLNNVMFSREGTDVLGILDWERWALGHPYHDIAVFVMSKYWNADALREINATGGGSDRGIPNGEQLERWYCEDTGRAYPLPGFAGALAYAAFQMLVGAREVAGRAAAGTGNSPRGAGVSAFLPELEKLVLRFVDGDGKPARL
ncbi:kinase-like domain-containing protein [Hyaloraphidium curvatum]|nr:kinase-like domain-containing protein [Hyaloraphidium curvatum]